MNKRVVKCYLKNLALLIGSAVVSVTLVTVIFAYPALVLQVLGYLFWAVIFLGGAALLTALDPDRRD
jgi:uncharacterized membrane protein